MLEVEISVTGQDPTQTQEYRLDREATALKKAGDMDGAIKALFQRKALMGIEYRDDKLAKYLQAAGRFDEALAEIEWLLATCHAFSFATFAHQPASVIQSQRCSQMAGIHAAAVLIYQREKRADLQDHHNQKKETYGSLRQRLEPLAKADKKQLEEDLKTSQAQGNTALRTFFQAREERTAKHTADAERMKKAFLGKNT